MSRLAVTLIFIALSTLVHSRAVLEPLPEMDPIEGSGEEKGCEDKLDFCNGYADKCEDSELKERLVFFCPKTCSACGAKPEEPVMVNEAPIVLNSEPIVLNTEPVMVNDEPELVNMPNEGSGEGSGEETTNAPTGECVDKLDYCADHLKNCEEYKENLAYWCPKTCNACDAKAPEEPAPLPPMPQDSVRSTFKPIVLNAEPVMVNDEPELVNMPNEGSGEGSGEETTDAPTGQCVDKLDYCVDHLKNCEEYKENLAYWCPKTCNACDAKAPEEPAPMPPMPQDSVMSTFKPIVLNAEPIVLNTEPVMVNDEPEVVNMPNEGSGEGSGEETTDVPTGGCADKLDYCDDFSDKCEEYKENLSYWCPKTCNFC